MAKRKAKKTKARGKPARKTVKRAGKSVAGKVASRMVSQDIPPASTGGPIRRNRIRIITKNLILFGILFVLSVIIAMISSNEIVDQLFWILAILTAFVAVAFLIVLLTFWFMGFKKR